MLMVYRGTPSELDDLSSIDASAEQGMFLSSLKLSLTRVCFVVSNQ